MRQAHQHLQQLQSCMTGTAPPFSLYTYTISPEEEQVAVVRVEGLCCAPLVAALRPVGGRVVSQRLLKDTAAATHPATRRQPLLSGVQLQLRPIKNMPWCAGRALSLSPLQPSATLGGCSYWQIWPTTKSLARPGRWPDYRLSQRACATITQQLRGYSGVPAQLAP